jgi:hypothetical protein
MSELPPKAQLVPDQPLACQNMAGGKANFSVQLMRYENWKSDAPLIGDGGSVRVDWPLTVTVLDGADASDPLNQLLVYHVRVGDSLAFRMTFTGATRDMMGGAELRRFAMTALVMIGVEHGGEIRDAIAVEREKFQAGR